MSNYRIVIADDHRLIRQGIKRIIESETDWQVIGEANDGLQLLELLKGLTPDMVLLDISMPNLRGFETAREIRQIYPGIKILILSMHREEEYLYHAFSSGASGYLLKEDTDRELMTAIEAVQGGEVYISPLLRDRVTRGLLRGPGKPPEGSLTTRECEVLKLIAEGKSSKEVADLLYISVRTVEHHRASIMKKLNLNTLPDLVKYAIQKGFTTLS